MKLIKIEEVIKILPKKFDISYFTKRETFKTETNKTRARLKNILKNEYLYYDISLHFNDISIYEKSNGLFEIIETEKEGVK